MKPNKDIKFLRDIIISGKPYGLYSIEDKPTKQPHNSWWVLMRDEDEQVDELTIDDPRWVEFDREHNQISWDISFEQSSTIKHKWNDTRFGNYTKCVIKQNGKHFYSFTCLGGNEGLAYAMARAQYLIVFLSEECAYDFYDPESQAGRKILWMGLPATIQPFKEETHNISIHPDLTNMTKEEWWAKLREMKAIFDGSIHYDEQREEWEKDHLSSQEEIGYINWGDASIDKYITWF